MNASTNILLDNTIYNNSNSNYFGQSGSTNIIANTIFNHTTIGVSEDNSSFVLRYTNNGISGVSPKRIVNTASPSNTTILITPISNKIILDTYKMNVIPSSNYVNVSSFNDDFNSNETYKKWSEISPPAPAIPITTRYTVGAFWNAYTSNSSGYITFLYEDGHYTLKRFEAEANNTPALAAILFLVIIVVGLITLFVIVKKRKSVNKIPKHQIG